MLYDHQSCVHTVGPLKMKLYLLLRKSSCVQQSVGDVINGGAMPCKYLVFDISSQPVLCNRLNSCALCLICIMDVDADRQTKIGSI